MDENGYIWIIKGPIILTVLVSITNVMFSHDHSALRRFNMKQIMCFHINIVHKTTFINYYENLPMQYTEIF